MVILSTTPVHLVTVVVVNTAVLMCVIVCIIMMMRTCSVSVIEKVKCACVCVYVCLHVYESVSYLVALLGHFIMRMLCILTRFYNWAIWAQKYI